MIKNLIESLGIGISIAVIPGPIFFELIRRTLKGGFWQGILVAVGEFIGNFLLLLLIFLGISSFLTNFIFQSALYLVGGSILVWLGIKAFQLKKEEIEISYKKDSNKHTSLLTGFSIAITSPIVIAFWVSLSGSYLAKFSKSLAILNIFFIVFGFMTFFCLLAMVVHKTRHRIPPAKVVLLSKIFGVILFGFGISFYIRLLQIFR